MKSNKNRWFMVLAAMAIHICIGSVYAWSIYVNPIQAIMGWSFTDITITFSIAIFFLGLSAALMGKLVEKKGPRFAATLAAIFFGLGTVGSGLAIHFESQILFYFSYGVLGGIGLGVGYISPVSMLVKWFPDRRGMATGFAIMGFGFASAISGPAIKILIDEVGVSSTFYILGSIYFIIMFSAAQYLANPPEGYIPEKFSEALDSGKKSLKKDLVNITRKEAIKTGRFYGLWIMLFINVTCGIAIISVASPLMQETLGISALAAASAVGLMGIFNGAGRIAWASVSDYLTRPIVFILFFITQIIAFYFLTTVTSIFIFQLLIYYIMMCYGGAFASIPAYIGDIFGIKELGAIHGYILTAWAFAGLVGPIIIAYVKDSTGSYSATLNVFVALFFIALIVSILMLLNIKKVQKTKS